MRLFLNLSMAMTGYVGRGSGNEFSISLSWFFWFCFLSRKNRTPSGERKIF